MLAGLSEAPTARAVMTAYVVPLADYGRDADGPGRVYIRFFDALYAARFDLTQLRESAFVPASRPLLDALARAVPEMPRTVREFRLRIVTRMTVGVLADPDSAATALGESGPGAFDAVVRSLIDVATGIFDAPVST